MIRIAGNAVDAADIGLVHGDDHGRVQVVFLADLLKLAAHKLPVAFLFHVCVFFQVRLVLVRDFLRRQG